MVKFSDCVEKRFVCNFFFFQNHAEALTLERTGIEDLVSAACLCREWNQKVRFIQGFDLTDGIGTGTGDDNIGQSKQILSLIHIFTMKKREILIIITCQSSGMGKSFSG